MAKIRFVMIGGFLGAGKTTTLARLARHFLAQGRRVGIITNDHASELVDTHRLRAQGFQVAEISGGCFCGSVDLFQTALQQWSSDALPEIVLVEPIGSCTDLTATVIRPLLRERGHSVEIAPYCVLLKPSHGAKILNGRPNSGFSPQAEYIFRKQLEEADCIALNRIDQLSPVEADELIGRLAAQYPGVPVVRMSATTGAGLDTLLEIVDQRGEFGQRILELDYDEYARGEAALGWLNGSLEFHAPTPFPLDDLLVALVGRLGSALTECGGEPAHLKAIGCRGDAYGVANLVSSDSPVETSVPAGITVDRARVILNARAGIDPDMLSASFRRALADVAERFGTTTDQLQVQCFRPGQPTVRLVSLTRGG